jgi:hypothetical protein
LKSFGLVGEIPTSIGDLTFLTWLDLSRNNITGAMPSSIGNLAHLVYLSLENNMISGVIPSSLGFHTSPLKYLFLGSNQLYGVIPSSFGDLPALEFLSLKNNRLVSDIPVSLGVLSLISYLDLGHNQFSGVVPPLFKDLSTLTYLSLENNNFTGNISLSFVNLVLLKELYLADNVLLTGLAPEIPGLIVLGINGTSLYFKQEITTRIASIESVPTETNLISDESGNGQTGNKIIIVVSLLSGTFVLGAVIAMIIYTLRRRTKKQRRQDEQKRLNEVRNNLYQMSKAYNEAAGNTEYTNLIFISLISSGAFGEVWKGNYRGDIVAIKKMKLEKMPQDQLKFIQLVLTEAKIMRDMQHERVVQFIGFDFRQVSIIMELMPCGALSSFIKEKKKSMKWSTRYQMMLDICEGMAYLHSSTDVDGSEKKILFRQDLKSANILLAEVDGSIRAKIGDFSTLEYSVETYSRL